MNHRQRIILGLAGTVVGLMTLFPPWIYINRRVNPFRQLETHERPAGYHLVFGSHVPSDQSELSLLFGQQVWPTEIFIRIDKERLGVQLIGVLLVTGILLFSSREARERGFGVPGSSKG